MTEENLSVGIRTSRVVNGLDVRKESLIISLRITAMCYENNLKHMRKKTPPSVVCIHYGVYACHC